MRQNVARLLLSSIFPIQFGFSMSGRLVELASNPSCDNNFDATQTSKCHAFKLEFLAKDRSIYK